MRADAIEEINKEDNREMRSHKIHIYQDNANRAKELTDNVKTAQTTSESLQIDQTQSKMP